MRSIPMSAAGLKEQYAYYLCVEHNIRAGIMSQKLRLADATKQRKRAHARWQKRLKGEG